MYAQAEAADPCRPVTAKGLRRRCCSLFDDRSELRNFRWLDFQRLTQPLNRAEARRLPAVLDLHDRFIRHAGFRRERLRTQEASGSPFS
jgi:hypothetical protein